MNNQSEFSFQPSRLKLTSDYYAKYEAISLILDEHPEIVDAVHGDLAEALEQAEVRDSRGAKFKFTSDTILRMVIGQIVEGLSLRQIVTLTADWERFMPWRTIDGQALAPAGRVQMEVLLAGMLAWSFFAGSTSEAMGVMLANANLIKKVRLPLVVFPLATVISHLIHFLLGMVVLLALMIIAGLAPGPQCLLVIPIILLEAVLAFAISLILSALNVFWRDVGSIWEVLTTAWFYVTPIIYPFYVVTPEIKKYGGTWLEWLYLANPMAPIMIAYRRFLLYGSLETIDPKKLEILNTQLMKSLSLSILVTGVIIFIGWIVFSKFSRSFADEL
jgi:ABC-2 type transport system permease protein